METFTLDAGRTQNGFPAIYPVTLVALLNGNPDGEAVFNSSSLSGDPTVKQLTSATQVFDGSTAPAGTWVVDLTSATDKQVINVSATANITYADSFTADETDSSTVTAVVASSNQHAIAMQIGPKQG